MTPQELFRIDRIVAQYLDALENDDFDTQQQLWKRAESESELIERFRQIHADLLAEQEQAEAARATQTLANVINVHLPSAEIIATRTGPVTVAEVVSELIRDTETRLPIEDLPLHDRLRQSTESLPENLGLSSLIAWAEARFGSASPEYWRAFRQIALKLELQRASEIQFQMAARKAPKPEGPK